MRIGQLEEKLKAAGAWDTAALTKSEEQILDVIKETIPPDRVRMKGREFDILDPKQVYNLYRFFTDAEANDALLLGKIESTIDDTLRLGAQVVKREKAALALGANPGQMAVIGAERSRIVKLLQQSLRLRDTHASFHARGLVAHRWLRRPSESGGVESKASEAANVSAHGTMIRIGFVGFQSAADARPMAKTIIRKIHKPRQC